MGKSNIRAFNVMVIWTKNHTEITDQKLNNTYGNRETYLVCEERHNI